MGFVRGASAPSGFPSAVPEGAFGGRHIMDDEVYDRIVLITPWIHRHVSHQLVLLIKCVLALQSA